MISSVVPLKSPVTWPLYGIALAELGSGEVGRARDPLVVGVVGVTRLPRRATHEARRCGI